MTASTRFFGTETEYGIHSVGENLISPIVTSTHVVVAFSENPDHPRARWDFGPESPLRDARGFDLRRYHTAPVIDPNALGVANVVLSNGGRFYVDHAHPEYSAPETTDAFAAAKYDAAGDLIMWAAAERTKALAAAGISVLPGHEPCPPLKIYKNNVDGKGASYGAHENYFYSRPDDPEAQKEQFAAFAAGLIPFFATRSVFAGAGRVGIGPRSEQPGFQLSQRADYIETEISLETTLNRGIINTRDEAHTEQGGRLHVIIGDANCSQIATMLKLGTTDLVLAALEAGVDFSDLKLKNPVAAVQQVSRDLSFTQLLELASGERLTALQLQQEYAARVHAKTDSQQQVLASWKETLQLLASGGAQAVADRLDWAAKYMLYQGFINRGVPTDSPKLQLLDLQYADLDPERSLYQRLIQTGKMCTLFLPAELKSAATFAPKDTRATLRGHVMTMMPHEVVAINWDSCVLQVAESEQQPTVQPGLWRFKWNELAAPDKQVLRKIHTTASAAQLVEVLQQQAPQLIEFISS